MSIRLIASGERAQACGSLQQAGYKSLITCLTTRAEIRIRGITGVQDGSYIAEYEGRGAHRDVYRFGSYVLKLERHNRAQGTSSNELEARSLQLTADLPQTVAFYHLGDVTIEYPCYRGNILMTTTMTANGLLQGYGGVTYDKLFYIHGKSPVTLRMASFLLTAYRDLALMVVDGVQLDIAYCDMHTANLATLKDPLTHKHCTSVASVVVDAEGVQRSKWPRSVFNQCADDMLIDLEFQCDRAPHQSWKILGQLLHRYVNRLFKQQGQDDLSSVRQSVIDKFNQVWVSFKDFFLPRPQHYAAIANANTAQAIQAAVPQDDRTHSQMNPGGTVTQHLGATVHNAAVSTGEPVPECIPQIGQAASPQERGKEPHMSLGGSAVHAGADEAEAVRFTSFSVSSSTHASHSEHYAEVFTVESISECIPQVSHALSSQHPINETIAEPEVQGVSGATHQSAGASSAAAALSNTALISSASRDLGRTEVALMPGAALVEEPLCDAANISAAASFASMDPIATSFFTGVVDAAGATVSTQLETPWANYGHYADSLRDIVGRNLELQRSSRFRGPDLFQQERGGRLSWEDRVAMDRFEKTPIMSRAQSDDVGRLCHLMFHALHNVLGRCSKGRYGKPQRRVVSESEFMKYGMAKRVFQFLVQFEYSEKQWFSPSATYLVVQREFDFLMGKGDRKWHIHGFQFIDEYEKDFLAHMITIAFLSEGVLHHRDRE